MDQTLGLILRQAVWDRLDMLDELVSHGDNGSLLSAVRSELPRLTHAWRALLATHVPGPRGRCLRCSQRWRRGAPCSVWRAAQVYLVYADGEPGPTAVPPSQCGRVVTTRLRWWRKPSFGALGERLAAGLGAAGGLGPSRAAAGGLHPTP